MAPRDMAQAGPRAPACDDLVCLAEEFRGRGVLDNIEATLTISPAMSRLIRRFAIGLPAGK